MKIYRLGNAQSSCDEIWNVCKSEIIPVVLPLLTTVLGGGCLVLFCFVLLPPGNTHNRKSHTQLLLLYGFCFFKDPLRYMVIAFPLLEYLHKITYSGVSECQCF